VRKRSRITLREFCRRAKADPGNISKIERGVWPPPQDHEILERYAKALGIGEGTDDWYRFFDYAAADRGIVPQDLMADEEVVKMLPLFFRTLRGERPTPREMMRAADAIRRTGPAGRKAVASVTRDTVLPVLRARKRELTRRFGLRRIGVFGSTVLGTANAESDVDVLVAMREPTFDRYMDLKFLLEDLFGRKVDLVLEDTVKPALRPVIERDVVYA